MSAFAAVVLAAALADNIVLGKMLGLCPYIGLSRRLEVAAGVGAATAATLTVACALAWGAQALLPADMLALRPLIFIALAACTVQAAELALRLLSPRLHRALGVYLPLIATNCAVLGVMLLALRAEDASFWRAVASGLGGGLGFFLAIVLLALSRRRTSEALVPAAFRGAPLAVLSAGIMALAFSGLAGAF